MLTPPQKARPLMMITGAPGERSKAGCTAGRPERGRRNERGEDGAPVEDGRRPFLLQCRGQLRSQSGLVGGLAEQDRAGVADQPGSVGGDLQGKVPPAKLHDEERSRLVDYMVVVTRNLPGPGGSSLFKAARDGRFAAVPPHSLTPPIVTHP